jgi:hypothetical protein
MSNSEQSSGLLKQIVYDERLFPGSSKAMDMAQQQTDQVFRQCAISAGPTFREPTLFDLGILVEEVMRQNAKQPNGRLGPNCLAGIRNSKTA